MNLPDKEKEILEYWRENKIFERALAKTKKGKPFVFYEGPPYANGKPGIHHVLARAFKDIILRFKTMQGFYVARKAGWDTHGLPTEMEVEKKLGVHTKKEIEEKIGIENFVEEARKNVFLYKKEWERLTERMAYWLDLEHPYVTMANDYVEALWWVFSQIAKKGYLYKDYKVLPWCPRCETSLSSHELAQGYKKVKEDSIYVKFQLTKSPAASSRQLAYFLVWTTTPWTLPGNVALAVNSKAKYATIEAGGEWLVLAKERLSAISGEYKIISEETGDQLVGVEYEPLYKSQISNLKSQIYHVVGANFVSTKDGTGIVHIAPAFGADDQIVGREHDLPTLITVSEDGRMYTPSAAWNEKSFQEANPLIIKNLEARKFLYKIESYEHDYPFCWRCKSALIYCAKDSWFLKTTAVKKRMVEENKKINWRPGFVGAARFGSWLAENVDWAISRERYWGMPLPIWVCADCGFQDVVGSLKELDEKGGIDKTEIYIMRHGEATHNTKGIVGPATSKYDKDNHLTERGRKQVKQAASFLKNKKIELIISSPLIRAKETAEIISNELKSGYKVNDQLFDINVGDLHGRKVEEVDKEFPMEKRFFEPFPGGESLRDVRTRMMKAMWGVVSENINKRILIISHGDPLWIFNAAWEGVSENEYQKNWYPKTAEIKKVKIHNWPYSRKRGELDMHRPYVDEITLECGKCCGQMRRVSSVADVWFDSGSMPYAQNPRFLAKIKNQKSKFKVLGRIIPYPADYICEGVDQTRGWFYTLLAVASLLELPTPFKNVIVNGLVLDENGEKMSKSRGNIVEPFQLFDKYGADAVRWYFYTINRPWDEKLFREEDVKSAARQFLMIFVNSVEYWKTYKTNAKRKTGSVKLIINKWLLIKLEQVKLEVASALEDYDVVRAARALESFVINDISHWYIRRIRDVMKTGKIIEKSETSYIYGLALLELSKMLAPFVPFISDVCYRDLEGKEQSVHLESWPKLGSKLKARSEKFLKDMNTVRDIVSRALEIRAGAGVKVRQPLASLKIKNQKSKIKIDKSLCDLIKGEVNVKEIIFDPKIKNEIELDLGITPELKEEGMFRDLIRQIQDMRKKAGLEPKDKIVLGLTGDKKFISKFSGKLKKEVGAKNIVPEITSPKLLSEFKTGELEFKIAI